MAAAFGNSLSSAGFGTQASKKEGAFQTSGAGTAGAFPASGAASFSGAAASSAPASSSVSSGAKGDWLAQKEEQARKRKLQNDLKKVEEEIHRLETRDHEIDALLEKEEVFSDVKKLMELNQEKEELAGRLNQLYEAWETLAECQD